MAVNPIIRMIKKESVIWSFEALTIAISARLLQEMMSLIYILYVRNNSANSVVASIDASLTKGTAASLSTARYDLAAMTLGDFALFGGGCTSSSSRSAVVDSYDTSLTMTVATSLSLAREYPQGIQVGDYGLFAGGNNGSSSGSYSAVVDVYTI